MPKENNGGNESYHNVHVEMVETTVRVRYAFDDHGNIVIDYDNVVGPSVQQLLEDLLDRLAEVENNSNCEWFTVTRRDEEWLDVWNADWRDVILSQEIFCQVCRYFDGCHPDRKRDQYVSGKVQEKEEGKKEEGKSEATTRRKPFRKLIKRPKS